MRVNGKYVSQALCVFRFTLDPEVRLKVRELEKAFHGQFPGQAEVLNVPDSAQSTLTRLALRAGNKSLNVSQVSAQLTLEFEAKSMSLERQLEVIERNLQDFSRNVRTFRQAVGLEESGIIVTVNYPSDESSSTLHQHVFDRFFKIEPRGSVASVGFQIGFETPRETYENYAVGVYELRTKHFDAPVTVGPSSPLSIAVSDIPVTEQGLEFKIDINNRPVFKAGSRTEDRDPMPLFKRIREIILNESDGLLEVSLLRF